MLAAPWSAFLPGAFASDTKPPTASEREVAVRYLEDIQRAYYRSQNLQPRVYGDEFFAEFRRRAQSSPFARDLSEEQRQKMLDDAVERIRTVPRSQYEDPAGYILLSKLDAKISKALEGSSVKLASRPVFGTLPTRNVNARTFAVPGSKTQIVAFEDQLWNFANLFAKAVAMAIPSKDKEARKQGFSTEPDNLRPWLAAHPEAAQRFYELMLAYIERGVPGAAPQYFLGEPHSSLASVLRDSMEAFVLGHEYGHVIGGHLGAGRAVMAAVGDEKFDELVRSWNHELEADLIGLQLTVMVGRQDGYDVSLSYWGADLFMTSQEVVDRALGLLTDGKDRGPSTANAVDNGSLTHPPFGMRRAKLRQAALQFYGEEGQSAVKLAGFSEVVVEELWKAISPRLLQAHKAGARPHRRWYPAPAVAAHASAPK